uniref:Very-long-chain (3R)-3-hydroxyacyl-CoA dehydratase n=1 Tax=Strongyloides stercoralis TaxID=6248 RepID=A0A0K0E781_STRER
MNPLEKESEKFNLVRDKNKNLLINNLDNWYFDSSDYRCCFNLFHAKIVTFIYCTLVLHEIVLGAIYLVGREEFVNKEWETIGIFFIRLLQLPPIFIAYYSLWKCNPYFIIPFGFSQICIGSFADIFTILKIIGDLDANDSLLLPFKGNYKIFNILLPLLIYILLVISLILVLYRCHIYFIARKMFHKERNLYTNKQTALENNKTKSDEGITVIGE